MPDGNPVTASNSMWRSLQWLAKEGERQLLNSIVLRGPCGRWVWIWKCKCVRPTNSRIGSVRSTCRGHLRVAGSSPKTTQALLLLVGTMKHRPDCPLPPDGLWVHCPHAARSSVSRPFPVITKTTEQQGSLPQPHLGAELLSLRHRLCDDSLQSSGLVPQGRQNPGGHG